MRRSVILLVLLTGSAFAASARSTTPSSARDKRSAMAIAERLPRRAGPPFFGQDAQYRSVQPSYKIQRRWPDGL